MKTLACLLALIGVWGQDPTQEPTDPNLKQYQNITLAMKFQFPKAWEVITDKQGQSRFLIPIEGASERAVVEVVSVNFRSDKATWQLSQLAFNKSNKRETTRQWEEEILGVPLLLTEARYTDRGSERQSVTGMLYTLGFNKMMYRVTASPVAFANIDYSWRQVLQTLRTWTGELPRVEDMSEIKRQTPGDPKTSGKPDDDLPHPQVPNEIKSPTSPKPIKAPVAATAEVNAQQVALHLPTGWKCASGADGQYTLTHPALPEIVSLRLSSTALTEPPANALAKTAAASLQAFSKVLRRDESLPKPNRAGSAVARVWREGSGEKGPLLTLDATGQSGDVYFVLAFRSEDAGRFDASRKLLDSLLDHASVEPAP